MARKSLADLKRVDEEFEEFLAINEYKAEMATEALAAQDAETRAGIEGIAKLLQQYATGSVKLGRRNVEIDPEDIESACLYLAVEIVKDLALLDILVWNFQMPMNVCVKCGTEL